MSEKKDSSARIVFALGASGIAVHCLLLRWIAYRDYQPPADSSFVNNLVVNITLSLIGALAYALFLKHPVSQFVRRGRISVPGLLQSGLWGIVATLAAFQALLLGAACFLTLKMKAGVPESSLGVNFFLSILEIETYGLMVAFHLLIPSFFSGLLATAFVARAFFNGRNPAASRLPFAPPRT